MSLKVVITGANGQLGKELVGIFTNEGFETYGYTRNQLDITNQKQVQEILYKIKPDIILHSAAFTKVDLAELEPEKAYAINAYGTRNIAVASQELKSKLVYLSTDYVFDGSGTEPYNEFSITSPLSVYGKSKLAGEEIVKAMHSKYFIVRTSWVFGKYGSNFVKTMMQLGKERTEISVVEDQIGSPTYTFDLARCILELVHTKKYGIYHITNSGQCSWYEFAKTIFEELGMDVQVNPCTSSDFPRPAPRPAYSVLRNMSLNIEGIKGLRSWECSLKDFIKTIRNEI
jgi:dTDP-4-dehydrorhamnose reductase